MDASSPRSETHARTHTRARTHTLTKLGEVEEAAAAAARFAFAGCPLISGEVGRLKRSVWRLAESRERGMERRTPGGPVGYGRETQREEAKGRQKESQA